MSIETRTAPTGTINASQLQRELVASAAVGAVCTGVGVTVGDPDDTIRMEFSGAADDSAIDAVIAAHPSYIPGVPSPIAVTSGAWVTCYETKVGVGEWLGLDVKLIVTTGNASTLEVHTIYFECMTRRRVGEGVKVADQGLTKVYGDLPNVRARAVAATTELLRVQVNVQRNTSLTVQIVRVESDRGVVS